MAHRFGRLKSRSIAFSRLVSPRVVWFLACAASVVIVLSIAAVRKHNPTVYAIDSKSVYAIDSKTVYAIDSKTVDSLCGACTSFESHCTKGDGIDGELLSEVKHNLRHLPLPVSASDYLHLLFAHGVDGRIDAPRLTSGRDVLLLFTDSKIGASHFGSPSMVRTRHGIRQPIRNNVVGSNLTTEVHCDQFLACMAQLNMPLTTRMRVDNESLTLRDVLRDSIACFDLKQREIAWTAFAYVSYLSPNREWVNKFDEHFTFDQLAEELLRQNLGDSSCCGSHIVESLALMSRVDSERAQILSPTVRSRLRQRLQDLVRIAVSTQHEDGSWETDWYESRSEGTSEKKKPDTVGLSRLLPTSHIPHWLLLLQEDLQAPPEVHLRAIRWCLARIATATPNELKENFCPACHTVAFLNFFPPVHSPE